MNPNVKPGATRDIFGQVLASLGAEDKRVVVLDADLCESTRSGKFAKVAAERFFEMGIQEANMISTAAGLASCGKVVFCCSFGCFITGRFDQIRVSVAYNNSPVIIVGTHAGVGIGEDGYTQMGLEDIAVVRSLPNMTVLQPCDDVETEQMMQFLIKEKHGPVYLRLMRQKTPHLHEDKYRFQLGKADVLREGQQLTIVATGGTVGGAMEAASKLASEGINAAVINLHTIAPIDTATLAHWSKKTGKVLTVEDHVLAGGMGAAVCEALAESAPCVVHRVAVREFGESGSPEELYTKHHLDGAGIYQEAKQFLARQ